MSERKKWNVEVRFKVSTLSTNTVCMVNAMKRLPLLPGRGSANVMILSVLRQAEPVSAVGQIRRARIIVAL